LVVAVWGSAAEVLAVARQVKAIPAIPAQVWVQDTAEMQTRLTVGTVMAAGMVVVRLVAGVSDQAQAAGVVVTVSVVSDGKEIK
jgi:hypothetical protein